MTTTRATDQSWLVKVISSTRSTQHLGRLGGAAIPAEKGLGIYRHAYRARLHECLLDDFPAVASLLGEKAFATLTEAVISELPPRDATLNRYGQRLVTWLRRYHANIECGVFARDIARLEWALVEAIHAPLAPPLDAAALAAVSPRRWSRLVLVPLPTLRRIASRWPIDLCYRQCLRGETVTVPTPDSGTVLVLRDSDGLRRRVIDPGTARLLGLLVRRVPLGVAISDCGLDAASIQTACSTLITSACFTRLEFS